jgi:hypothetical protein
MGLLDQALGRENPVSQYVDSNPSTIHGLFSGLATGQNISDGLSAAAQNANAGAMQDRVLQQQMAGRNQTADWLAAQPNPNLAKLAPLVRSGLLSGGDALAMAFKPGISLAQGDTLIPNALDPANTGAAPVPQPTAPAPVQAPPAPSVPLPQINPDDPTVANVAQQLQQAQQAFAPPAQAQAPAQTSAPSGGAPSYVPGQPFTAPANDPLKMTAGQRADAAAAQGLLPGQPGYANFILTGRMPNNATETWHPATPQELQANGISPSDPSLYQASTMGNIKAITGAISAGTDGPPLGTTGQPAIDPTTPGYSSKTVTAGLTQATIDQRALGDLTSGTPPPTGGRTGLALAQNTAIANRMAELDPTGNLAANKVQVRALSQSLANQQKYLDTTQRSVANAEAGFQQVISAFKDKGINTSQYPSVNAMANAVKAQLAPGDLAAYQAGLTEVANEYSQVFSRGGQVTDAVRSKSASIANGSLSVGDLGKVLTELQAQGNIVVQGSQDQVKRITGQINDIAQGNSSPDTTNSNQQPQFTEGQTSTNSATGAKAIYHNGAWTDATTGQPLNGQ